MLRSVTAFLGAAVAACTWAGTASDAQAGYRPCRGCGPLPPHVVYRTVEDVRHHTRYRDVVQTRYVPRVQRIVHVTRVQPVHRIHHVTRVHHRTVGFIRPVHVSATHHLPPRTIVTRSIRHSYDCGCR